LSADFLSLHIEAEIFISFAFYKRSDFKAVKDIIIIIVSTVFIEASNRYKKLLLLEVASITVKHKVFFNICFKASFCASNLNIAKLS